MSARIRRQKQGAALVLVILAGYFAVIIGWQFATGIDRGYGTGFSNLGHVPASVAQPAGFEAGVENDVIAKATNKVGGSGVWNEAWRLTLSIALLVGIIFTYYLAMSRLGTF